MHYLHGIEEFLLDEEKKFSTQIIMNFDEKKYKVYTWKNWMMLHWIINPGLAINELVFGQRVPKIMLVDKTMDKPYVERQFVPCPHCNTIHDARIWSNECATGFRNWFGLYCTNCGNIIPCLRNLFSWLILGITFPIWGWFKNSWKAKWLAKQPQRYENIEPTKVSNSFDSKSWIRTGLAFGILMFLLMSVFYLLFGTIDFTIDNLIKDFVIWMFGGLVFGFAMKLVMNKRPDNRIL
jgi:hypothetical protein